MGAAPIFREVMIRLHRENEPGWYAQPTQCHRDPGLMNSTEKLRSHCLPPRPSLATGVVRESFSSRIGDPGRIRRVRKNPAFLRLLQLVEK